MATTEKADEKDGATTDTISISTKPSQLQQEATYKIQATYAIKQYHDLLNGFVPNLKICDIKNIDFEIECDDDFAQKTILDCIDEALDCLDKTWDNKTITNKTAHDVRLLLSEKQALSVNVLSSYYHDIAVIYDEMLAMALKTKEMNFVIKKEKMIYIPENWQEEQVESIKNKLTMSSLLGNNNNDDASAFPPQKSQGKIAQFNVSNDVFAYVLRDKGMKHQNQLSRNATIHSDIVSRNANSAKTLIRNAKDFGHNLGHKMVDAVGLNEEKYDRSIEMIQTVNKITFENSSSVVCAGCRQRFELKTGRYVDTSVCIRADIMDEDEWFCFHDEFCVVLRRLKESIRRYALNETLKKNEKEDVRTVHSYVTDLFENYDQLITVEKHLELPKPFGGKHGDETRKDLIQFNRTHIHQLIQRFDRSNKQRNKSSTFPKTIQFANFLIYGESLATFVIHQLSAKQSDALWLVLGYIMQQIPTTTAISILEQHRLALLKVQKVDNLEMVLSSVVQASTYNVATALYLSAYIQKAAHGDMSRNEHWTILSEKYVDIALQLANSIESDHLLSLLMEIPTDIAQQSAFQIAIEYNIIDFLDNARSQRILRHLWSEFDFLNPHKIFRTQEIGYPELLHRLITKPNQFYYCPVGGYWIDSVMYVTYVAIVTGVVFAGEHDLTLVPTILEWLMWIFTIGYIAAEISQFLFYGKDYMRQVSNLMDICIIANWIIIASLRFHCFFNGHNTECVGNDSRSVLLHMFFFCIQVVVLWSRIAILFRTSDTLGPFIAMLPGMIRDVATWAFLLSIFFVGFGFGANFIIAGDIQYLHHYELVFEYTFITLMGQSDWQLLDPTDTLSTQRSVLLKVVMWAFAVMGTILLVNLLIAMMASTYEHLREDKTKFVNFARSSQIYSSAYRYAVIPPPLNIIVYVVAVVWATFEMLVLFSSCRYLVVNLRMFDPISVDFYTAAQQPNDNANPPGIKDQERCCGLCLKMSPEQTKRICRNTDNYKRSAKYCRFCRCFMRDSCSGSLQEYFSLFRNYRLDARDKKYLIALIGANGVCPECYRPYLKTKNRRKSDSEFATDRLHRRIVILEMISFWVFMVVMYLPLILIIAIPALFGRCYHKIDRSRYVKIKAHNKTILVRDDKFTRTAESIVAEEDSELEQLADSLARLEEKMEGKFKELHGKIGGAGTMMKRLKTKKRLSVIASNQMSQIIGDEDMEAALEILENIEADYHGDAADADENTRDLNIKMMENELEELMINKQLREHKREDAELLHRKYDTEESKIKLKMQILLKKDDDKHDALIGKLHDKLNAIKLKRKQLNEEMDKTERTFKFEDTQHDESVNEIKNKLEKLRHALTTSNQAAKADASGHRKEESTAALAQLLDIEQGMLDDILNSGLLDDD